MTLRLRISNDRLPGWMTEATPTVGTEQARHDVLDPEGVYVGAIVYCRRRNGDGSSEYGWRPERSSANSKLTDQVDAVRRLERFPS